MTEHSITIEAVRRLDGQTWHQAVCSCGYISARAIFPGRAEAAGKAHARDKGGADHGSP